MTRFAADDLVTAAEGEIAQHLVEILRRDCQFPSSYVVRPACPDPLPDVAPAHR